MSNKPSDIYILALELVAVLDEVKEGIGQLDETQIRTITRVKIGLYELDKLFKRLDV